MNVRTLYDKTRDHFKDGVNVNSVNRAKSDLKEYIVSQCYHPIKIWVYDSALGQNVQKELPCGSCYHCRETRVNEWVTRLYAHLEDYKFCYFVTLTYRSFRPTELKSVYNNALIKYLSGAYYHLDDQNQFNTYTYSPCLCDMSHFSGFMKRLRKNTGINDMTFFSCCEYGHNFGRPHFHAIIFSNDPISTLDIYRAWGRFIDSNGNNSRNSKRKQFKSFGRIQCDDLVADGTISNKKIDFEGNSFSAHQCFAYVAKYCGKLEFNNCRVRIAYDEQKLFNDKFINYETKSTNGEKFVFTPSGANFMSFEDFCKIYAPRINCSRGTPIGSKFLNRHIKEMASGIFAVPPLQKASGFPCIKPSYFYRKSKEYLFSIRTISEHGNFSKGSLPKLCAYLCHSLQTDYSKSMREVIGENRNVFDQNNFFVTESNDIKHLIHHYSFVDLFDRSRYLLFLKNNTIECQRYIYDRSLKDYVMIGILPLEKFACSVFNMLDNYYKDYIKVNRMSLLNKKILQDLRDLYIDLGVPGLIDQCVNEKERENRNFLEFKNVARYQQSNL